MEIQDTKGKRVVINSDVGLIERKQTIGEQHCCASEIFPERLRQRPCWPPTMGSQRLLRLWQFMVNAGAMFPRHELAQTADAASQNGAHGSDPATGVCSWL